MGRLESAHRAVWRRWGRAVGREAEKGEGGWMDGWMDGRGGGHATTDGDGVRRARVPLFPPPVLLPPRSLSPSPPRRGERRSSRGPARLGGWEGGGGGRERVARVRACLWRGGMMMVAVVPVCCGPGVRGRRTHRGAATDPGVRAGDP